MLLQKSLDYGKYREEPEGMKTEVRRKGGPVLETMAIYASPSRIVRVSKAAYLYAQQRHMDHATRKSSCLHFNEASIKTFFLPVLVLNFIGKGLF